MNAVLARFIRAAVVVIAMVAATGALAAKPRPEYAEVVITFAGQSFGFAGRLRHFEVNDAGGQVALDLATLESPAFAPPSDVDATVLRAPGNNWQVVTYLNRSPVVFSGTCALESFRATEFEVSILHVYLNCADLDACADRRAGHSSIVMKTLFGSSA